MNNTVSVVGPRPHPRRLAMAVLLALGAGSVHAFSFESESGEVKGSFDTTLSIGATWRMQDRDPSLLGITNGGTARDPNSDDGNLNYKKGGVVYSAIKATHDFELSYRNYGLFLRGTYFFDPVNDDKNFLGPEARDRMVSDADLLDAYVRGTFDVGGRNLNARLGSQVVSWGESTFILNGINVINSVDVTKLRTPGAELKEGLIPSTMVWASQEVNKSVTVEGFVLANWDKTKIDPRGSFFSTNDFISDDGDRAYFGFGRRNDQHNAAGVFPVNSNAWLYAPRSADRGAKDSGQYGLAARLFTPELNNTEFSFYHMNYHSRVPYVSGYRGGASADRTISTTSPGCTVIDVPTFGAVFAAGGGTAAAALAATNSACAAAAGRAGTYFADYPENIRLYGLSFNTPGPAGIALQGEWSYRPNQPLQLPSAEILLAALGLANQITSTTPTVAAAVPYGTEITGYRRVNMHQLQATATKAFGPTFGAEQLAVVGEVGYTLLSLPSLKFAGPGVHLPQPGSSATSAYNSTSNDGFVTENSWGYRLLSRLDYPNAIGATTVSPRLAFAHDVSGVGPTFNEATKAATLGLGFDYRQNLQADIAYTWFWGGRTYAGTDAPSAGSGALPPGQSAAYASSSNPLKDRDFLALSVSYSF